MRFPQVQNACPAGYKAGSAGPGRPGESAPCPRGHLHPCYGAVCHWGSRPHVAAPSPFSGQAGEEIILPGGPSFILISIKRRDPLGCGISALPPSPGHKCPRGPQDCSSRHSYRRSNLSLFLRISGNTALVPPRALCQAAPGGEGLHALVALRSHLWLRG